MFDILNKNNNLNDNSSGRNLNNNSANSNKNLIIESIIQKRKPFEEKVLKTGENLDKLLTSFERFSQVFNAAAKDDELSMEFSGLSQVMSDAAQYAGKLRALRSDIALLQKRFSRDTLNIAVIGRARQGKSRLLQTITGLGKDEIPDGNLAFCTGVRSDIINDPTVETAYAKVNFLSEKEFMDEKVAPYFKDLQEYDARLFTPANISEFQNFRLPSPGTFEASPEARTQMNLHLKHLQDLQEHLNEYARYLGQPPERISKDKIREYVAQDNVKGERVFFKHMAVASVEIFCSFPNSDVGKLRLIDLPGLGDTRKGDVEQVVRALSDQVDLVFFLSKPSTSGAAWQDNEINLYSQARRALGEKLPIEKWSFWVFNHDATPGADNSRQCELLKNSMSGAQIQVSDSVIVNCTDVNEVASRLIEPALNFLLNNITNNDREYAGKLQADVSDNVQNLQHIMGNAESMLKDDKNEYIDHNTFDNLFEPLWKQLKTKIQYCVGPDSELRLNKNQICEPLRERTNKIFADAENGSSFPFNAEILADKIAEQGGMPAAYQDCLGQLRTSLSRKMQEDMDDILDAVLTSMKDKFGDILGTAGHLENRFNSRGHELLGKLIQHIKDGGQESDMPTVLYGLELLDGFKLNYRSFAQHRIREALNSLDLMDPENVGDMPSSIADMLDLLQDKYEQAVYELRKKFNGADGIYIEPNSAAFAIAEEFKDIVIRSGEDGQLRREWRRLYWPIRGDVWPNEYGSSQKRRDASARMREPLNDIVKILNVNSNFVFAN